MKLSQYKYMYFIGIGGIGMSALARYFLAKGVEIYGYDRKRSKLCDMLELEGMHIHYIQSTDNILSFLKGKKSNEVLVIYTPAVSQNNIELVFFQDHKYTIYKRSEILGLITNKVFTIAVSGTHGKTTTTTILAHILKYTGKEFTAFLGGISKNYNTNFLLGKKDDIIIVEADEYDYSFLELEPDIAIITSVDYDHMDIYKNKNDLEQAFIKFVSQIKPNGLLVLEESILLDFRIPKTITQIVYSANKKSDCFAQNINFRNGTTNFDLFLSGINKKKRNNGSHCNVNFVLPGKHNISNAVAAACVSSYIGIKNNNIEKALETFSGIKRRFDIVLHTHKLMYIDDYAHHPDEVTSTINTVKELFPERFVTVVFQPHLFSRTQSLAHDFAMSLSLADQLILLDIYPAREEPITGVDSKMLLDLCLNPKKETCSKEELLKVLANEDIDILLTLGAGDISSLVEPIKCILN